eukprot:CAMPEP_0173461258 /NCGR_PEP_ID=MMETSP1357-20121228/64635_1 /TAXON_ID=77926 /ORGANISM="Hemiselmis rufescens, Strain PCC563" /LENGTH=56 /DNA_ID=CAMNT_0014428895 /DNA_START=297 /DNA_END=464 /DNA_ORIENTATION=-
MYDPAEPRRQHPILVGVPTRKYLPLPSVVDAPLLPVGLRAHPDAHTGPHVPHPDER